MSVFLDRAVAPSSLSGATRAMIQWRAPLEVVRLEGSCEPEFRRIREWEANVRSPRRSSRSCARLKCCRDGLSIADAVRQIGVTQQTYYRWRKLYGGMGREQLKRLKELEKENQRLRRAVSDLTLDKLILTEAAQANF